jgi:hypothetical protein
VLRILQKEFPTRWRTSSSEFHNPDPTKTGKIVINNEGGGNQNDIIQSLEKKHRTQALWNKSIAKTTN